MAELTLKTYECVVRVEYYATVRVQAESVYEARESAYSAWSPSELDLVYTSVQSVIEAQA